MKTSKDYVSDFVSSLLRYKTGPRLEDLLILFFSGKTEQQSTASMEISKLINLLKNTITNLRQDNSDEIVEIRRTSAEFSIRLSKLLEGVPKQDSYTLEKINKDRDYFPKTLQSVLEHLIDLSKDFLQKPVSEQQTIPIIIDKTGTKIGKFLASHFNFALNMAVKENPNPLQKMIEKGGYTSTMYESVHQIDKVQAQTLWSKNVQEVLSLFQANVSVDDAEDEYKKYLFNNVQRYLEGTFFRYSESMSREQNMAMLWIRATHVADFEHDFIEQRIYVNLKPAMALDGVRYIARTITEFLQKNPSFSNYVYFKYKIRTILSETDRADTCVCYLKLAKGLEKHKDKIIEAILQRIMSIPDDFLNKISSSILIEKKAGITTVTDDVVKDSKESYTSQIGKVFYQELVKYNKNTYEFSELPKIANDIILKTILDLRKRKYPC